MKGEKQNMNKFLKKVAATLLGFAMVAGVGVAVSSGQKNVGSAIADAGDAPSGSASDWIAISSVSDINTTSEYLLGYTGSSSSYWCTNSISSSALNVTTTFSSGKTFKFVSAGNSSYYVQLGTSLYLKNNTKTQSGQVKGDTALTTTTSGNGTFKVEALSSTNSTLVLKTVTPSQNAGRVVARASTTDGAKFKCYAASNVPGTNPFVTIYKKSASLSSISVKTAPTKTSYLAGETFDPTGLVITRSYSDNTSNDYAYDGHSEDFTFTPSTSTALTTSNTSVTIGYGGKTTTQSITVTAPKTPESVSSVGHTTSFTAGNKFAYDGTLTVTYTNGGGSANVQPTSFKIGEANIDPTSAGTVITTDTSLAFADHNEKYIYVLYTENNVTVYTSYQITVTKVTKVTFTASTDNPTGTSQTKGAVTISTTSGVFSSDDYRIYKNQTFTVTSSGEKIGKIEFACTSGKPASGFAAPSTGTWVTSGDDGTWTAPSGGVETISFVASNEQVRATVIVVHFLSTDPSLELSVNELSLKTNESSGKTVTATVLNVSNPTITWTRSNTNITIETGSVVDGVQTATIKPNTDDDASSSITVAVTGTSLSATISVDISVPGKGESPETAYTASEAIAAINAASTDIENIYVTGIISQIDQYYSSSHSINYWISDDGTTTSQFKIYGGKGLNEADFNSIDEISLGDTVVLYGTMSHQYKNLNSGNYIVSRIAVPQVNSIVLTPSTVIVAPEDAGDIVDLFTNIVINQDAGSYKTVSDIVWATADDSVFYIDGGEYLVAGAHKTSTTISASIGGKQFAQATINVIDPNHPFITYDIPEEWTIVADISTLAAGDQVILTGVKDSVAYAATTYSSGNNVPADTTNTLTVSGSNVTGVVSSMVYTLEEGSTDGTLAFKDSAGKYLYAASSSSNNMKSQNNIDGNASFILNSDGTVVAQGSYTRCYMRYNNDGNSNLFSCYGSTSTTGELVTFYKQTGGGTGTVDLDATILNAVHSVMDEYQDEHGDTQYGLAICNYYGRSDLSDWDDVAAAFTASIISTYHLAYARANRAGNDVEKFLSAYDYVVENYGEDYDFLDRIASGKVTPISQSRILSNFITESTNTVIIITVISLVSVSAIGGYFFLRRRKENI